MENPPIVCDNGTRMMKVGFADDDEPTAVFPTVVGLDENSRSSPKFGEEAEFNRSNYSLSYPIERGIITNWDGMEKVWNHAFCNELGVDPREHPVLLSEAPLNPEEDRRKMVEIMFESFGVPATLFVNTGFLALAGRGFPQGIALESGHGMTHCVPVVEGCAVREGIYSLDVGGADLSDALKKSLAKVGYRFAAESEEGIVGDIKEKLCYVAADYKQELEKAKSSSAEVEETYELPDGRRIKIGKERFMCPEALFQPSLIGERAKGIHELLHNSIMQQDEGIRRDLISNIVISGGSMMFPGMARRLEKEIHKLRTPERSKMKVRAAGQNGVWLGGSSVASLHSLNSWISKEEYDETGRDGRHIIARMETF